MHKDTLGNEAFSPYGIESIYPWTLELETVSSERDASLGKDLPVIDENLPKGRWKGWREKKKKH